MKWLETVHNNHNLPSGTYEGEWNKTTVTFTVGEDTYEIKISKSIRYPVNVTLEVNVLFIDIWQKESEL